MLYFPYMHLLHLINYFGKRICVSVSGGMDSVCLLHLLVASAEQFGYTLSALTCEHGIRGENSIRDMKFVQTLCKEWNIPLFCFQTDIPSRAKKSGRSIEEEGRVWRYECYSKIIDNNQADFIATAHHKDDEIETVLFRLARGTSLGGLTAITEHDAIIRPFLHLSRKEIAAYATQNKLSYVTDESNFDEAYTRNALRLNVLPALERAVNGAGEHLLAFARRAKTDDDYLNDLAGNALRLRKDEAHFPADLPAPLFSRACIIALKTLGVVCNYTSKNIEEVTKLKRLQSGKRVNLPQGIQAVREGNEIAILKQTLPFMQELPFQTGTFTIGTKTICVGFKETQHALYADADAFPNGCVIRTRREGDVFTPFHGHKKPLKKYLTDKKIPARIGNNLPLIAKENEIFAIFGVEISDFVKIGDQTKEKIYLSLTDEETDDEQRY